MRRLDAIPLLFLSGLLLGGPGEAAAFEPPIFVRQFGESRGRGPLVLGYVSGIGVDSSNGEVYVTDVRDLRRFDRDGNFVTMWSCAQCYGVDVNGQTGDVYVARVDGRVSRFTREGVLVADIGGPGSGPGEFDWPHDVSVDPQTGNLYVSDVGNARVQQLDASGAFIRAWGSQGSGDGQFSGSRGSPSGISFDPGSRTLYVSDAVQDTIQKFDESGNFLLRFPAPPASGCQPAGFRWIRNISVDRDGNLLVADADAECISLWSPQAVFLESFQGPHDVADGPLHPRGVTANLATGEVYVAAAYATRVHKFDADRVHVASWGDRRRDGSILDTPTGIATSPVTGDIYVFATSQFRIKRFASNGAFQGEWGEPARLVAGGGGVAPEGLLSSFRNALTVDASGDVWAVTGATHYQGDPPNYEVQRFDAAGSFRSGWLVDDMTVFSVFTGAAVHDETGRVFVSDLSRGRVSIHDASGALLGLLPGIADPAGLAIHDGFLFVVEAATEKILKFEIDGAATPVAEWGGPGVLALGRKTGIAVGPAGHVFVADTSYHRVQVFDTQGNFVGKFGTRGPEPGKFDSPHDVAIGPGGLLHVLDHKNDRVQTFLVDVLLECGDGLDNDGNGLTDAEDHNCYSTFDPREGPVGRCGAGPELALLVPALSWLRSRRRRHR